MTCSSNAIHILIDLIFLKKARHHWETGYF